MSKRKMISSLNNKNPYFGRARLSTSSVASVETSISQAGSTVHESGDSLTRPGSNKSGKTIASHLFGPNPKRKLTKKSLRKKSQRIKPDSSGKGAKGTNEYALPQQGMLEALESLEKLTKNKKPAKSARSNPKQVKAKKSSEWIYDPNNGDNPYLEYPSPPRRHTLSNFTKRSSTFISDKLPKKRWSWPGNTSSSTPDSDAITPKKVNRASSFPLRLSSTYHQIKKRPSLPSLSWKKLRRANSDIANSSPSSRRSYRSSVADFLRFNKTQPKLKGSPDSRSFRDSRLSESLTYHENGSFNDIGLDHIHPLRVVNDTPDIGSSQQAAKKPTKKQRELELKEADIQDFLSQTQNVGDGALSRVHTQYHRHLPTGEFSPLTQTTELNTLARRRLHSSLEAFRRDSARLADAQNELNNKFPNLKARLSIANEAAHNLYKNWLFNEDFIRSAKHAENLSSKLRGIAILQREKGGRYYDEDRALKLQKYESSKLPDPPGLLPLTLKRDRLSDDNFTGPVPQHASKRQKIDRVIHSAPSFLKALAIPKQDTHFQFKPQQPSYTLSLQNPGVQSSGLPELQPSNTQYTVAKLQGNAPNVSLTSPFAVSQYSNPNQNRVVIVKSPANNKAKTKTVVVTPDHIAQFNQLSRQNRALFEHRVRDLVQSGELRLVLEPSVKGLWSKPQLQVQMPVFGPQRLAGC